MKRHQPLFFAAASAVLLSLGTSAQAQLGVIEDFEGFADTAALQSVIAASATPTANTSIELGSDVDGSNSLNIVVNNGADPFFGQVRIDVDDISLDGVAGVAIDFAAAGGSQENIQIELLSEFSTPVAPAFQVSSLGVNTQTIDQVVVIDTSFTSDTLSEIQFTFGAIDFGTTTLAVDNIAAVPEPGALMLAGATVLALGGVRRRR